MYYGSVIRSSILTIHSFIRSPVLEWPFAATSRIWIAQSIVIYFLNKCKKSRIKSALLFPLHLDCCCVMRSHFQNVRRMEISLSSNQLRIIVFENRIWIYWNGDNAKFTCVKLYINISILIQICVKKDARMTNNVKRDQSISTNTGSVGNAYFTINTVWRNISVLSLLNHQQIINTSTSPAIALTPPRVESLMPNKAR